jgi:hypothetical protein
MARIQNTDVCARSDWFRRLIQVGDSTLLLLSKLNKSAVIREDLRVEVFKEG